MVIMLEQHVHILMFTGRRIFSCDRTDSKHSKRELLGGIRRLTAVAGVVSHVNTESRGRLHSRY